LSFKPLFSRSLSADPERLHFAAHSHHLWPDASFEGQLEAWNDAARLADRKWDKVMGEVWPEAQGHVARELGTGEPSAIVFAPNTHELLVRLFAAVSSSWPIKVLTSDAEFHSARRQFARWEEAGAAKIERIPSEPFESFPDRFLQAAKTGAHDFIFVPAYTGLDRIIRATMARWPSRARPRVPLINHVRAPALISALLLIIYFPLISGRNTGWYFQLSGHPLTHYLRNWLLVTVALFLGSGLIYVTRCVRSQARPPDSVRAKDPRLPFGS